MLLDLRRKATIEEGIVYRERLEDGREVVEYEPGDGTRYLIIVSPLTGFSDTTCGRVGIGKDQENVIVTLANNPGAVKSMVVSRGDFIAYDDVHKSLGFTMASSVTLAEFLGWLLGGSAWSCEEAQEQFKRT